MTQAHPPIPLDERGFAILRIKRKRGAEPVDALVIEQATTKRAKRGASAIKSSGAGIFRFAATVELASFANNDETKQLEDHISSLAREAPSKASPVSAASVKQHRLASYRRSNQQARFRVVQDRRDSIDGEVDATEDPPAPRETYSKGLGRSLAGKEARSRFAKIWDAVEEKAKASPGGRQQSSSSGMPTTDMDAFQDMLKEYLRVSDDAEARAAPQESHPESAMPAVANGNGDESEDEASYVYDVYYRARTPIAGEEVVETYGAVTGLTAADLLNDDSGESDSDKPLSDEEDSNEEDFYRNDYPEGESDSSEEIDDNDPFATGSEDDDDSD